MAGLLYSRDGKLKNHKEALKWFKEAATPDGSDLINKEAQIMDEETYKMAQYAVGVSLLTGNPGLALAPNGFSKEGDELV